MNIERIRERLSNGFKPFMLELSSGRRVKVPHPDFIMIGRNVVVVMGENDSVTTVDALHIAAVEELPASRRRK
jgi:hypothetical protein